MLTIAAAISLFIGSACCYSTGLVMGWLLSNAQTDFNGFRVNLESDSAKRLRIEVRDNISRIILEVLEKGDTPTQHDIIKSCPAHLRTGKARIIWQRESQLMLNMILSQSLTEPLSGNSKPSLNKAP